MPRWQAAVEKKMPIVWHMPHPPLYESLLRKTSGRVLRSDGLEPEPGSRDRTPSVRRRVNSGEKVPGVPNASWREASTKFSKGDKTRKCPLYYDVKFEF